MSSGPAAIEPEPLSDQAKRALLAVALTHQPDKYNQCGRCRRRHPCAVWFDTIHRLIWAGVDPDEWRPRQRPT